MAERRWLDAVRALLVLYLVATAVTTLLSLTRHGDNNFLIFRGAYQNLLAGRDLYALYPDRYADRFKYSPTFALLFAPFALLPVAAGLMLWNVVNAAALWGALARLLPPRDAVIAMLVVLPELAGNLQNAQSNALVSALVVGVHIALDADRPATASLSMTLGTFVKLFPAAAGVLALLRPRLARFAASSAATIALFAVLPLVVIRPTQLLSQYASWLAVERSDALAGVAAPGGRLMGGVMQQLRVWTGVHWPNWPIQIVGVALLLAPLLTRRSQWGEPDFRLRALASVLVFMVIFNHQAESPSFVIAMTGVAIWYAASAHRAIDRVLLGACLVFVSLVASSLVPLGVRREVVRYGVKAVPCIIVWIVLQLELFGVRTHGGRVETREVDRAKSLAYGG